MDKKTVLKLVEEKDVKFIEFWFTDILGVLKSFTITKEELEAAFNEGMGFDGSSIRGFVRIDESDMVAVPEPDTFVILPWRPKEKATARMFCDILTPDGKPFEGDPRYILKRNLDYVKKKFGLDFYVGPELEYFYFKNPETTETLDRGGYFDLIPRDEAIDLRRETTLALEEMNIKVEYAHHEVAPSQHEIDLRYTDALTMADIVMTHRLTVKEIAFKNGVYATFMPKPLFNENGSGMHTHMSLFKNSKNAFFNQKGKYYLSETALQFIAGLLKYTPELCSIICQWVNSYKRLVPGYEAPVYLSWAVRNRSDLVRVPMYKPGKEKATRIELRAPDPACNPYLAFACMLRAGIKGMEEKLKAPEPIEENIYEMTENEKKKRGIKSLPGSLIEALGTGEKLVFSLKWNFVTAGVAEMRIDNIEQVNVRSAYHIITESRSLPFFDVFYKIRNRDDSYMDTESLCSLKFESHHRESGSEKDEVVLFDHINGKYKLTEPNRSIEVEMPAFVHDSISALYYLRTMDIKVGEEYFFDCQSGDKIYPLRVVVHKKEKIHVPAGKFECYVVEPFVTENIGVFRAKGRLWIWLTCDDRKIPVLMKSKIFIGSISAVLTELGN